MRTFTVILILVVVFGGLYLLAQADPTRGSASVDRPGIDFGLILQGLRAEERFNDAASDLASVRAQQTAVAAAATADADRIYYQATLQADEGNRAATLAAGEATRQAEATRGALSYQIARWTAEADADRATSTAEAVSTWAVYTQAAVAHDQKMTLDADAYIDRARRRVEQGQELTNKTLAVLPVIAWVAFGLASVASLALFGYKYWLRPQEITRDARGDSPILISNDGIYYDPDRNPGAAIRVYPGGASAIVMASEASQAATTARDQAIDLQTRGALDGPAPVQPQPRPAGRTLPPLPVTGAQNYKIIPAGETPPEFAEAPEKLEVLEGVWKEVSV